MVPFSGSGSGARVELRPSILFPGLRPGERLRRAMRLAPRGTLLASDRTPLAEGPDRTSPIPDVAEQIVGTLGPIPKADASVYEAAGYPPNTKVGTDGLERVFESQLAGTPGGKLLAGHRVLATAAPVAAGPVTTTISPTLERETVAAMGGQYAGITVMNPRTGALLALAGIAFSAPQPPGSTMKIITTTGALQAGITTLSTTYPVATSADVGGYTLQNSNGEACGGTLINAFAVSCNSVFAPLGVQLGAKRLVAIAQRFGFDQPTGIPGAAESTIPSARTIGSSLAVGSSAIGQGKVLSTPLEMADVAATIAMGGRRPIPTLLAHQKPRFVRVISPQVAHEVQQMMIAVVDEGTGTTAQIPGVVVAGKTGTAEQPDTTTADRPIRARRSPPRTLMRGSSPTRPPAGRSTWSERCSPTRASAAPRPRPRCARSSSQRCRASLPALSGRPGRIAPRGSGPSRGAVVRRDDARVQRALRPCHERVPTCRRGPEGDRQVNAKVGSPTARARRRSARPTSSRPRPPDGRHAPSRRAPGQLGPTATAGVCDASIDPSTAPWPNWPFGLRVAARTVHESALVHDSQATAWAPGRIGREVEPGRPGRSAAESASAAAGWPSAEVGRHDLGVKRAPAVAVALDPGGGRAGAATSHHQLIDPVAGGHLEQRVRMAGTAALGAERVVDRARRGRTGGPACRGPGDERVLATEPRGRQRDCCGDCAAPVSRRLAANTPRLLDCVAHTPPSVATAATMRPSARAISWPSVAPVSPLTSVWCLCTAPRPETLSACTALQQSSPPGVVPASSSSDEPGVCQAPAPRSPRESLCGAADRAAGANARRRRRPGMLPGVSRSPIASRPLRPRRSRENASCVGRIVHQASRA